MAFTIRPVLRCFPVLYLFVKYRIGSFFFWHRPQPACWRFSGDLPMRRGEILSLNVTLPNEQRILKDSGSDSPGVRGGEFGNRERLRFLSIAEYRLVHYMRRLTQAPFL